MKTFTLRGIKEGKINIAQAKAAILKEVERLKQAPITEEELQRAKNKTVARVVYASQSANATAGRLASDFIHTGNPDYLDHYAKEIQKVTAGEVMAAANKFLKPNRLITIQLLPQEGPPADITRPETLPALFDGADEVYHLAAVLGTAELDGAVRESVDA